MGDNFWMSSGGTTGEAGKAGKAVVGGASISGSMDDTEGSVVAVAVAVGGGTAAAPGAGVGVGLGSAMFEVTSVLTRFGSGELGNEGGICWLGVSLRSFEVVLDILAKECGHSLDICFTSEHILFTRKRVRPRYVLARSDATQMSTGIPATSTEYEHSLDSHTF